MRIRPARRDELSLLRELELAAGCWFRDIGMVEVADHEPPPVETLAEQQQAGRILVAVDDTDRVVAYVVTEPVDGTVHIEQVSVHPEHARQGIGRELLEHVAERAAAEGVPALTLTTFVEVPWNMPYYLRCGFRVLPEGEWTPGLRTIREREVALGLDQWPRVVMRRDLP